MLIARRFAVRLGPIALAALFAVVLMLAQLAPARAATLTVNTTSDVVSDDGQCSLREAISAANSDTASGASGGECAAGSGADIITVPAGTDTLTLGSELAISADLTLNGAGAPSTIIEAAASPGTASGRVINITAGTVSISGVTVRNGKLADHGAGILNVATLTVTDSTFSDNDSGTTRHGGCNQERVRRFADGDPQHLQWQLGFRGRRDPEPGDRDDHQQHVQRQLF
jgi:CSLREA domain-containing protein